MITVFLEANTKVYFSYFWSVTGFLHLFLVLFVLIFPFLAAYASDKFWIRNSVQYEIPFVNFNSEYMLYITKTNTTYFHSSWENLNNYYPRLISNPQVYYIKQDSNYDGYIEQFSIKFEIPKSFYTTEVIGQINQNGVLTNSDIKIRTKEIIQNVKLGLFFEYSFTVSFFLIFQNKVKMSFNSMIYIDIDTPESINYLKVLGNLGVNQKGFIHQG